MFNSIKVYSQDCSIDDKPNNDYIVQIDEDFYIPISRTIIYSHPDLTGYDLLFSTSSLDELEIFILKLLTSKDRSKNEDKLLYYFTIFIRSYIDKLLKEVLKEVDYIHELF